MPWLLIIASKQCEVIEINTEVLKACKSWKVKLKFLNMPFMYHPDSKMLVGHHWLWVAKYI